MKLCNSILPTVFLFALTNATDAALIFQDDFSGPFRTVTAVSPNRGERIIVSGLDSGRVTYEARRVTAVFNSDKGAASAELTGSDRGELLISIGAGNPVISPVFDSQIYVSWAGTVEQELNMPFPSLGPSMQRVFEIDFDSLSLQPGPLEIFVRTILRQGTSSSIGLPVAHGMVTSEITTPTTLRLLLDQPVHNEVDGFELVFATKGPEVISGSISGVRLLIVPEPGTLGLAAFCILAVIARNHRS